MKTKIMGFVLAICLVLPCSFAFSACGTTDCAYIQFAPAESSEVVQYTSTMYAVDMAHLYLFESEQSKNSGDWDDVYILKIEFKRGLGVDNNIDTKPALCVDIAGWSSMRISIKKDYYDNAKKVYLNGVDITSQAIASLSKIPEEKDLGLGPFWIDGVYYFEDFGLIKGNTTNFINIIEYKF